MEEVKELLKIREKQLMHLKSEKEKALKKAPDGLLRVCNRKKKAQYYHRKNSKDINGVYIREKDIKIAQALAQKVLSGKLNDASSVRLFHAAFSS